MPAVVTARLLHGVVTSLSLSPSSVCIHGIISAYGDDVIIAVSVKLAHNEKENTVAVLWDCRWSDRRARIFMVRDRSNRAF